MVYVPTYNPYTVYYPPPAYVYNPYAPLVTFGAGIAVGAIIANNCDWYHGGCYHGSYHGDVNVNVNNNYNQNINANRNANVNNPGNVSGGGNRPSQQPGQGNRPTQQPAQKWQPDQSRLSKSGAPSAANTARTTDARGWGSGGGAGHFGARPSWQCRVLPLGTSARSLPPAMSEHALRPEPRRPVGPRRLPARAAPVHRPAPRKPGQPSTSSRPSSSGSAFGGVNSGSSARNYSSRGASSSGSRGGYSGGGGGGGGRGGGRARRRRRRSPMRPSGEHKTFSLPDMRTLKKCSVLTGLRRYSRIAKEGSLVLALALNLPIATRAADTGETFATPEEAVSALVLATGAQDGNALRTIFGPAAADLQNPDRVQATNEFNAFTTALNATNRLVQESDTKYVLEVGANFWPFPVPIVKKDGRWFFDTEAGEEEIFRRRIGKNELATLDVVRSYVDAQRQYASRDRNGDEVLEYAQRLASTPGAKDGLFWPPELDGEISPLGPLVAQAQGEGYRMTGKRDQDTTREPFHGYFFKILTCQGKHAPGGKYNYVINGHMIGGFALVAWPAEYGESGIMTFIVNQQGRVYQRDLGPKTDKLAAAMKTYDPDTSWSPSSD